MRWIRYEHDGAICYGILEGDSVEQVSGSPFEGYEKSGERIPFAAVKLLAPVIPPTFYAAGLNYVEHIKSVAASEGRETRIPEKPDVGYRAASNFTMG